MLKASNSLSELSSASEAALKRLGCSYGKNGNEGFAEFEVTSPHEFTVRIEDMSGPHRSDWMLAMFSREEFGCSFVIVTPPENRQSIDLASNFVRELLPGLKRKPWEGLGHVRSRTAKILWDRWQRIPQDDDRESFSIAR